MADKTIKDEQGNVYRLVEVWIDWNFNTSAGMAAGRRKFTVLEPVTGMVATDSPNLMTQ